MRMIGYNTHSGRQPKVLHCQSCLKFMTREVVCGLHSVPLWGGWGRFRKQPWHYIGIPAPFPFLDGPYLLREVVGVPASVIALAVTDPLFVTRTCQDPLFDMLFRSDKVVPPTRDHLWLHGWDRAVSCSEVDCDFSPVTWMQGWDTSML
jgi:hypothetical protein